MARQLLVGQGLLIVRIHRDISETRHVQYDSLGRVISPLQRTLFYNRQHCHDTDIHAPRLDSNQQSQ